MSMASATKHADGNAPQAKPKRSNAIRDHEGTCGACTACSVDHGPILGELQEVRQHGAVMQRVSANHVKNVPNVRSVGQNHEARRQWLRTHTLYSRGSWVGHAQCFGNLTETEKKTLARLGRTCCERRSKQRMYPACVELKNEKLLKMLVYDGEYEPEDWASLESRCNRLKRCIPQKGDQRTPVPLPLDSILLLLHGNVFQKRTQKVVQLERFKYYFTPPIRRLRLHEK